MAGLFDMLFGGGQQQQQQQRGPQINMPISQFLPSMGGATNLGGSGFMGGAGGAGQMGGGVGLGGGGGSAGAMFSPLMIAALIGMGKNTEANHPDTAMGKGLLGTLGPSISQVAADPKGMGIPTALGLPFLTPFTGSDKARRTRPEWSGMFGLGF